MQFFARSILFAFLLLAIAIGASAQSQPQEPKEPTASISGRVTLSSKPVAGVIVTLTESNPESLKSIGGIFSSRLMFKATTDEDGRYHLDKLAAGRYAILPFAPALVIPSEPSQSWPPGRIVILSDGEALEKVDFALTRGGAITGRVINADGRPAIATMVTLTSLDDTQKKAQVDPLAGSPFGKSMYMTDDRGVYRLFGLPAGRYILSIGAAETGIAFNMKSRYHTQTYHPGVTDKAKATIIELKEGSEVTGADIRLGLASKTYKASGRIIDADTGKPVSTAVANYGSKTSEIRMMVQPMGLGALANSKGEFNIDTLIPGSYYAFAWFDEETESYSDLTPFEITNGDVTGLVVKVHRGQSVSGMISIEGTSDPDALASVSQLQLGANITADNSMIAPKILTAKIAPDGSFRIAGVQPGKMRIYLNRFLVPTKLNVLRVERGGVVQTEGIQISPNETVSDIRVVLANASGVIRGQVVFEGGTMPDDMRLEVKAAPASSTGFGSYEEAELDASGRFKFENLLPGEYDLTIQHGGEAATKDRKKMLAILAVKQRVTVTNEIEANVTLTVDLNAEKK